jgi:hypothetical protein
MQMAWRKHLGVCNSHIHNTEKNYEYIYMDVKKEGFLATQLHPSNEGNKQTKKARVCVCAYVEKKKTEFHTYTQSKERVKKKKPAPHDV